MQERASEPSKTSVRRYRSRHRKSFLRRHKIALPAAGMLLYGGLMAAVASSGDFPGAIYDILHSWSSKPSSDTVAEPAPEPTARPLPELAVDSVDGKPLPDAAPQVSFLAAADGAVPTETLKSETPDDEGPADSANEPGQETLPSQSPPGGTFAVSSGGTVGLLVQPFGAPRTTSTFTMAGIDPPINTLGGFPRPSGLKPGTPTPPDDGKGDACKSPKDPPPDGTSSDPETKDPSCSDDGQQTADGGTQQGGGITVQMPTTNDPTVDNPPSNTDSNPPTNTDGNPPQNTDGTQPTDPENPPQAGEPPVDTDPVGAPVVTVPEPASLTLVGPAVLGLWMLRRRRKRDRTG